MSRSNETPLLELDALRVRYGRQTVVEDIDLRVEAGEVVALVGRNGAGKTSLVRCLLGQQRATSGTARLFGRDAWRHRVSAMARTGVVPEEPDAPPRMSPRHLAAFSAPLYPRFDRAAFDAHLRRFEVPGDTPFGQLSRGQKAQVQLALALAARPDLLVLDDPTLGLDAVARRAIFEGLVDELAERGTTVLLTSHDLPGVEGLATRVAMLVGGTLIADEAIDSLKARHRLVELPLEIDPTVEPELEAELSAMAPVTERRRGRRREVLVSRFDAAIYARWRDRLGATAVDVHALDLEEIVISTTDGVGERIPEEVSP